MAITTFDTLKFVRKLEEAGVPVQQAEVQAEVLTEAFTVNLDALVTKDYLAARFAEQQAYMDTRFTQLDAKFESKFQLLFWIQGILVAGIVLPYLERMLTL
ncbi:MAG: hypothetical protein QGG67_00500 [Gammaproteobacteria bacterium]|jgi:hypothetical protein|nr:hypothetical protein [Gammaproteobacteria bacterium]MDP6094468.1 hypothetical protein [Gammaproteobacteria bacterium]HJO10636.1 hypothetical protein [Gammaproteobacteria bacterium]|tara:strand:- start:21 stop:323 length:303 start_codon:yes stop_codon:yes gene_type:complete